MASRGITSATNVAVKSPLGAVPGLAGQIDGPGSVPTLELGATLVLGATLALNAVVGTGADSDGVAEAVETALLDAVGTTLGDPEALTPTLGASEALGAPVVTIPEGVAAGVAPVAVALRLLGAAHRLESSQPDQFEGVLHAPSTIEEAKPHTARAAEFEKSKRMTHCF